MPPEKATACTPPRAQARDPTRPCPIAPTPEPEKKTATPRVAASHPTPSSPTSAALEGTGHGEAKEDKRWGWLEDGFRVLAAGPCLWRGRVCQSCRTSPEVATAACRRRQEGGKKEVATGSRVSPELRRDPETLLLAVGQRSPGRWEVGEAGGTHRSQGQCCRRMRGCGGGEGWRRKTIPGGRRFREEDDAGGDVWAEMHWPARPPYSQVLVSKTKSKDKYEKKILMVAN